jgi:hypothetical protein
LTDDYFGLKKLDKDLKKVFKNEDRPSTNHRPQKPHNHKKSDLASTAKMTKQGLKWLNKQLNKNKIPKTYQEIMDMRDRLELEQKQKKEMQDAIIRIKELQRYAKAEQRLDRRRKINKIKQAIKKFCLKSNNKENSEDKTNEDE